MKALNDKLTEALRSADIQFAEVCVHFVPVKVSRVFFIVSIE
jgi:hypothetical protein